MRIVASNKGHFTVFREAWKAENERRRTETVKKRELEFLPAALEILEKPPSPLGRIIVWAICAFVVIALLWAFFGRIDIVASAPGRVLPRDRVKVVQASEIGVVREIYVREGQRVEEGQPLIDLESTDAGAEEAQAAEQLLNARIEAARGEAVLRFLEGEEATFEWPEAFGPLATTQRLRQQGLIAAQIAEFRARRSALIEQRAEKLAEIEVARLELAKVGELLPLAAERESSSRTLMAEQIVSRSDYLEAQGELISLQNDRGIFAERQNLARAAVRSIESQLQQIEEEFRRDILAGIAEAEAEGRLAAQELDKRAVRRGLRSLTAPVDGVIQQLVANTEGGVVQPAEQIMVIVPGSGELIVEANVLNKDIGFVAAGDPVEVKLEAFPFTKFGVVDGVVETISRDAIQDEDLGLVFLARIKLDAQEITIGERPVALTPGMSVTAEIKTGQRRVIEYVLAPLLRYRDEALRER